MEEHTERELLLAGWFLVYTDAPEDDEETRAACEEERVKYREQYLAQLEPVGVSRCPFTGEELVYPVDTVSLDGPFWDVRNPLRHAPPDKPSTFWALSGALQLAAEGGDIPYFPFLAQPGPEVPFVIPSLLEQEGVKAVVSATLVGANAGFAIAYFADPKMDTSKLPLVPEWGSARAWKRDGRGGWTSEPVAVDPSVYDYDVARWIERGKLQWIEPYDRSLELRTGLAGCPYPRQPGHREIASIEDLEVSWPSGAGADD